MSLRIETVVTLIKYPIRVEGMANGDGFVYLDTKQTAEVLKNYLLQKYKDYGRFQYDQSMYEGEITIYCPVMPENVFNEVKAICALLVSHDKQGNRLKPLSGLLKAENGADVIRVHAKVITVYNRPKAGTTSHYEYLESLKK